MFGVHNLWNFHHVIFIPRTFVSLLLSGKMGEDLLCGDRTESFFILDVKLYDREFSIQRILIRMNVAIG